MKKVAIVLVLVLGLMSGSAEAGIMTGDTVRVISLYSGTAAGPLVVDPSSLDEPNFVSFCIELQEHINTGRTYFVEVSDSANAGGVGGTPDPLDVRTAFLYNGFLNGAAWFDGSDLDKTALQMAIWRIEEELDANYAGTGNPRVWTAEQKQRANELFNLAGVATAQNPTNFFGVVVLRLWNDRAFTEYQQDIIWRGVPDGGASLMLLGGAMIGIASLRRRFSR